MVSNSKRTDPAWQFFDVDKEKNTPLSADVAKRHLKSKHPKSIKLSKKREQIKILVLVLQQKSAK